MKISDGKNMELFDGKKAASQIFDELEAAIKKEKIRPVLAVILAGEDEASKLYIKLKKEAGAKIGIIVDEYHFSDRASEEEIIQKIKELDEDKRVNGIIVQLPLPAIFNADRIIEAISPEKDVDGFHPENRKLLEKNKEPHFLPVLPQVILTVLSAATNNEFSGKNILALVNSEIFGRTLKSVLGRAGARIDYLARQTCAVSGAEKGLRSADVIISVCGCPHMIKGEMIKDGAILIDGGITRYYNGKTAGDIDRESVAAKAAFLTPVPGGIGPLTVALLLRNVYLAARRLTVRE